MSIDVAKTRTLALLGHGGDGKTTLADSMVMATGFTNRLGSVEDGTSFMNYLPEERKRRLTISTGICTLTPDDLTLTLLDAPGDSGFAGEAVGAVVAADIAVIVLSAQSGVRLGTEKAIRLAQQRGLALCAVANKMDVEQADYAAAAQQLEQIGGLRVVRLHLPLGSGPDYRGYVNLLTRKAHVYADESGRASIEAVPPELASDVETAYQELVEAVAEGDDSVLERYLEEGELPVDVVTQTLRKGVRDGKLLPLISAAATRNVGGAELIELASSILPSPAERPAIGARRGEETVELAAQAETPLVAYVFKSVADRYAGTLSILRVISGTLRPDMTLVNASTGTAERISKILTLTGEATHEVEEVGPGQIAALPKLKDTHTGDTLSQDGKHPVTVPPAELPVGVIAFAVEATIQGEEDKVFDALHRLVEEDPTLDLRRDERTGEFLLRGLGQLHIEVTLEKLHRLFKVEVQLHPPKVPYQETVRGRAMHVEGKLKKQSGGRGQFGVCYLNLEPGPRGSGVVFLDEIVGGAIPRNLIPAVEKGIRETCEQGILAGFPVTDIQVHCIDGKYHAVDSSEQAFKLAGSFGLKAAFAEAGPTLLEPIMKLEISIPDEFVGDIMGNLNSRRGRVAGVEARGGVQTVSAQVPMSEVLTYASDLTSITGGQGSFTMEFSHYDEVPKEIQERIVAEHAASQSAE